MIGCHEPVGSRTVNSPLQPGQLAGTTALVTGSSRGIGADTARYFAAAGANVVINYRSKAPRADKLVAELGAAGTEAIAIGADLTDPASVEAMMETIRSRYGTLEILVLNASGGMESGMGEDYALRLNRDAQVNVLTAALPLLGEGSRVVFVTSHQAHFIRTTPTMPEYEAVAISKRAGEDALREHIGTLADRGIGMFGVEAISPAPEGELNFRAHRACAERGITHMECLATLDKLVGRGRFRFIGFPLRIRGGTASPIRAVALFA